MQTDLHTVPQVDEALRRVYARPELAPRRPGAFDGIQAAIRRFWARVGELLGSFGELRTESPVVYWLVMGSLVALGVAIVGYFIYTTLARLNDGTAPAKPARAPGRMDARARSAGEWEEEARRAAAEGRYRDAAVALYQALLLRLEAAGAVRYDPSKTPGDYRREARQRPEAGALTAFLRGFEPAVFGGRTLDAGGYDRLRGAAEGAGARG